MFDFLKKKITGFVNKLVGKKEIKEELIEQKPETKPEKQTKEEPKLEIKKEKLIEQKPVPKKTKIKIGLTSHLKSLFSSEIELTEKDISQSLDDFELGLLESDVALEVAEQIKTELKQELVGKKIKKKDLQEKIAQIFFDSINNIMNANTALPLTEQIKQISAHPIKIMFIGPNGSGKTTTIAKIANLFKKNKYRVVIAAADTFRAAAIEQMTIHANKLGIEIIKGKYGADPTSVAFDALNYAKAHAMDIVLIDSAGRQETNQNLLNELKKMVRVINPEIKVYVGESIAGNAIIDQVDKFNKELKLDGVILTKIDCDAKGGTILSISKVTRVPILYITTGQKYEDIEPFNSEKIAKNIVE